MDERERSAESGRVFGLLARIVHRTAQDAAAELRRHDLTPAQFQLLRAVRDRPGSLQRELSEHFHVTGGNVSMLVAKLETAGLLRREASGAAFRVSLTDAGAALVGRLEPEQDAFLVRRFAGLSGEDLSRLGRLLDEVVAGLPGAE